MIAFPPRLAACLLIAMVAVDAARAAVELEDGSSEAQLMGFYASAMAFTALGRPAGRPFEAGVDAAYLPSLSAEDRQTTFAGTKVENTNFTNVLPRPRLRWRPDERWLLEAGFFPAIQARGITPAQIAAAAAWRAATFAGETGLWVRAHYLRADVEGPITCSEEAVQDPGNVVCFGGEASEDHFRPQAGGLDVVVEGPRLFADTLGWYASAGWERQTLRFATHFVNIFGRLDDQELVARLDRASMLAGVTWRERRGLRLTFEASYVPDALATARVGIQWAWGNR